MGYNWLPNWEKKWGKKSETNKKMYNNINIQDIVIVIFVLVLYDPDRFLSEDSRGRGE